MDADIWHTDTIKTWKTSTTLRLKFYFQNEQNDETIVVFPTAALHNMKAMAYKTRTYYLCDSKKFEACFLNWNINKMIYSCVVR